jgi:hypothetical protein
LKYIVAVKYKNSENLKHNVEIFEFDSELDRKLFIHDIKPIALDISTSELEDKI